MRTCRCISLTAAIALTVPVPSLFGAPAAPKRAMPQPIPLSVTLSVTSLSGKNGKDYVALGDPKTSFDITIKNVSSAPQKIYPDEAGPGYYSVSLQILAINGKRLPKPIAVTRASRPWAAFSDSTLTLLPGAEAKWHILVTELERQDNAASHGGSIRIDWNRMIPGTAISRLEPDGQGKTVTVIAVFGPRFVFGKLVNVSPDGENVRFEVWPGKAVSPPITFQCASPLSRL